jgi:hypothetical protein
MGRAAGAPSLQAGRRPIPPLSVLNRERRKKMAFWPKPPLLFPFPPLSPCPYSLSLFFFQIAPRIIINCRINTVKP